LAKIILKFSSEILNVSPLPTIKTNDKLVNEGALHLKYKILILG
jgi:hypothetical protein